MKLVSPIRRSNRSATILALFAALPLAFSQNVTPPTTPQPNAAHTIAFDVVSMRPSPPGGSGMVNLTATDDGYKLHSQPLWLTILIAYFPQNLSSLSKDRLSGAPAWLDNLYDIDAKVSETDLADWQKQGADFGQKPMLRQMLQTMLADRCHLIAHMVPSAPINGFAIEPGKHAPHLTESKSGETLPPGMRLHDGGVVVPYFHPGERPRLSYYGVTMTDFAQHLTFNSGGHPVQDRTGLTGHYDFVLNWNDDPDHPGREGVISSDDPNPLSHWDIQALGLRLTPTKLPIDTLVIDHIEKPSEN